MRGALAAVIVMVLGLLIPSPAQCGPPFVTDDPEPTAPQHWEIYAGYTLANDTIAHTGTLPFVEVNWGPRRNVQLALTAAYAFSMQGGAWNSGIGDLDLGVKFRFIPEARLRPQVAVYPIVSVPTGNASRDLGEGATALFLPLWLQKQIGAFTVYGGGGVWNRTGTSPARWGQTGLTIEAQVGSRAMVGVETYRFGAQGFGDSAYTALAWGAAYDLDERHRLLLSFGRSSRGAAHSTAYLAIEALLGHR
jgi:hypothetical protein